MDTVPRGGAPGRAEPVPLLRAFALERAMVRVRWVGIALGVFQIAFYTPPQGTPEPAYARPAGFGLLGVLLLLNLLDLHMLRREPQERSMRQLGVLNFAVDMAFLWAMVWVFNFEEFGTTWVVLYVATLEGALRYRLAGAMVPVAVAAVLEPLRDLFRQGAFGYPFLLTGVTFRVGIMAIVGLVAGIMARNLGREREAAERRAALVATVAAAARGMSTLDPEQVLGVVVDSGIRLGFDAVSIGMIEEGSGTYRISYHRGLPDEYVRHVHPLRAGAHGAAYEARRTVVVEDYAADARAMPEIRDAGFRAMISTPVWSQGRVAAVLSVGTIGNRAFLPEEVEALELLGAQAGRALENAQRFEDERRAVERLAELDRLKGDFLSMVSHEIRTPLTAIEGMGLTLEQNWVRLDEETRRELLARMNTNSRALDGIISSLLDFSRLEAGRMQARVERVDLRRLLESVASRVEETLAEHTLFVDVAEGVEVIADPMLLDRVVENLLSNAGKHTPEGTAVVLSASAGTTLAEVAVTDTGPGIEERDLGNLGERFYRGGDPSARRTKGIGLGLAFVREILRLHESELAIESHVGSGSRFSFRLPLAAAAATPSPDAGAPSLTPARPAGPAPAAAPRGPTAR